MKKDKQIWTWLKIRRFIEDDNPKRAEVYRLKITDGIKLKVIDLADKATLEDDN